MLVLTRKTGERILIGDDIVIQVLRIKEQRVRIGMQAPQDTTILRAELTPHQATQQPDDDAKVS